MHLKKLTIELQEWGVNEGKYEIEIAYKHERSETKLFLPPDVAKGLLELVSKNIVEASQDTAKRLCSSMPEQILNAAQVQNAIPETT